MRFAIGKSPRTSKCTKKVPEEAEQATSRRDLNEPWHQKSFSTKWLQSQVNNPATPMKKSLVESLRFEEFDALRKKEVDLTADEHDKQPLAAIRASRASLLL